LVLIAGIVSLPVSGVPHVGLIMTKICEALVNSLNSVVAFFEKLPISQVRLPYISPAQTILLFALAIMLMVLFRTRRYVYMRMAGITAIVFFLVLSYQAIVHTQNEKLVWYAGKHGAYVEAVDGLDVHAVAGSMDNAGRDFQAKPLHRYLGAYFSGGEGAGNGSTLNSWTWQGKRYLLLREDYRKGIGQEKIEPIDVLAVDRLYTRDWEALREQYRFRELIITGYTSTKFMDELTMKAERDEVAIYFLREKGLLIL
ncbi:MAG: hypothetical protein WBH03_11965, partial [Cyclobacteriaceae bacterium]